MDCGSINFTEKKCFFCNCNMERIDIDNEVDLARR